MIILLFLCALLLSGVAAFYSVMGIVAIFAAAPIPIGLMGTTLEVSKLVIASWLYRNWAISPRLMKGYLTTALIILMALTSLGVFGFLSKAHSDQGISSGDVSSKVALIDEKIKTEKENIDAARRTIAQLDSQVNQALDRTTTAFGVDRSTSIRRSQIKERAELAREIEDSQTKISKLNEERAPLASEFRKIEAEVGPIKYIAALIYGDATDQAVLEKAVRWVTIMIVAVFDPLAVVMLIAANWSLVNRPPKSMSLMDAIKEQTKPKDWPEEDPPQDLIEEVHIPPAVQPIELPKPKRRKKSKRLNHSDGASVADMLTSVEKYDTMGPSLDDFLEDNSVEHPVFSGSDTNQWLSRPPPVSIR